MMKIKSQYMEQPKGMGEPNYNPSDVNIRRLLGHLEQKQQAANSAYRIISSMSNPSLQEISTKLDLVEDLRFLFGNNWYSIAAGEM